MKKQSLVVAIVVVLAAGCRVPVPTAADLLPTSWTPPVTAMTVSGGSYGPDPSELFDLYLPTVPPATGTPLIIWAHGGGWFEGSRSDQVSRLVMNQLGRGVAVASIDYRLTTMDGSAPNPGQFPNSVDDVEQAVAYFKANAALWNLRPDRIILAGLSAGAYLVTYAGLQSVDTASSVVGILDEEGPVDLAETAAESSVYLEPLVTHLLGCPSDFASCDATVVARADPIALITAASPPIYAAYGTADPIAAPDMGGEIDTAYSNAGIVGSSSLDFVSGAVHSQDDIDFGANLTALNAWIDALIK